MRHLLYLTVAALVACNGNINDPNADGDGGHHPGGGNGDGGPGEFGPDAMICDQTTPITATQQQATPDMLLVLDKSGSMSDPLGNSGSKWDVMRQALTTVLPQFDMQIHWGMEYFSSDGQCGAGVVANGIAPNNTAAILGSVNGLSPGGATPTYSSIDSAKAYYATIPVNPDGRFVLLATDGLPNCGPGGNGDPSVTQSIASIAALNAQGIKTFVIGFGDVAVSDPTVLNQFATAGGTGSYYPATSPAQLQQALQSISGSIVQVSCTFDLQAVPPDASKLSVTLDGNQIPRDPNHAMGWDYDPATNTITFYGATCNSIQSGSGGTLGIDYGCGGPVIG
jgi:hypothetical protein